MPRTPPDHIKPWFVALERLGENVGIRFGHIPPGGKEPAWTDLRHAEVDGIGGLAEILRQRGAAIERLPETQHPAPSSVMAWLRFYLKLFRPRRALKWRSLSPKPSTGDVGGPPPALAWRFFDESTTATIRRRCREHGVTVNSFLLHHFTQAIRPSLADPSAAVSWLIPVNLRGPVTRARDTENHSSYVAVKLRPSASPQTVHQGIYAALARGEHWFAWKSYALAGFLPFAARRFLLVTGLAFSQWNIGGFSNLGVWDPEKKFNQDGCAGSWLFCPPVLRCQRLGVGCMTFQNRLSLTVQVHPDLTQDPEVPDSWMRDWLNELEGDLSRARW